MPTLNPGPGIEMTQEQVIAVDDLETDASQDVYMKHLASVEFADAKIKGAVDIDAIVKITAIEKNKVTFGARTISGHDAIANLKTGIGAPVQIIARGY